jgi:hypothetical protein
MSRPFETIIRVLKAALIIQAVRKRIYIEVFWNVVCTFETSVTICQSTRLDIPEDLHLQ